MTPEQQAAYIIAQSACALIEALGMFKSDVQYTEKAFDDLIDKYGIHHNGIISFFQGS